MFVPVIHELNAGMFSSSYLVHCGFLFPDFYSDFCYSAHTFYVDVFNSRSSFGVDGAPGKSGKMCTVLTQQ